MKRRSDYRAITYFDAVRRHGSVREAARQLGTAASAVNRQILKFEAELGVALFERLSAGMTLTPAGEIVARHAMAVLQDEHRTLSELDALQGLRRGKVEVVAVESLNASLLPAVLRRMTQKFPGIEVTVRTEGSNSIPRALADGDADIGLAFSLERNAALRQLEVAQFVVGAVMRPDHALAKEAQISLADCSAFPVILPTPSLSTYSLLKPQLRRFEGRLQVAARASSLVLMKNLVIGLGAISFQTPVGLEADIAAGQLVHIPLHHPGPILSELGVYAREGRSLSPAMDIFVSFVRAELLALSGSA